jgi:hypothetical protein
MKCIALSTMILLFSAGVSAAGALAIDSNQGDQYGFAFDYATIGEAESRAISECGSNCSIVQTFEAGCAAYAADQTPLSTIYGWATSDSSGDAQNIALQYCSSQGGSQCIVRAWGCNSQ